MAGRGPVGKDDDERVRRAPRAAGKTERLTWDGVVRGHDLPEVDPPWPSTTVRWWESWRRSAVASRWQDTDWHYALATAVIHAAFWSGRTDVANELRLREAAMGATLADRKRMAVDDATGQAPPATVTDASTKRARKTAERKNRVGLRLVEPEAEATGTEE